MNIVICHASLKNRICGVAALVVNALDPHLGYEVYRASTSFKHLGTSWTAELEALRYAVIWFGYCGYDIYNDNPKAIEMALQDHNIKRSHYLKVMPRELRIRFRHSAVTKLAMNTREQHRERALV